MSLFPLFANLKNRPVLVLGGGEVAERKVAALREADAEVRLSAPELNEALRQRVRRGDIVYLSGPFQPDWLDAVWLVVLATPDRVFNRKIADQAEQRRILTNVVDDGSLSTFHAPARLRRGPLTIAVSTAGHAPALARRLRADLEIWLDDAWSGIAALARSHRTRICTALPDNRRRRAFLDWLLDGPVANLLRQQRHDEAEKLLADALEHPNAVTPRSGRVTLVGAGPGAAGLLTLDGLRALQQADVILHDRLIGDEILNLARRDAKRIDVGKLVGGDHEATQRHIHELMRVHARAGHHVVRLKGGDSLIFGRGGEELEYLSRHDIAYAVVPGISAAIACAAYAGVPLTHRQHAQSVHLATAHRAHDLHSADWAALARENNTVALYMAVAKLETLRHELQRHGRAASTPFALVENGTCPEQRVLTGELQNLPAIARSNGVRAPALLIIGETAALARQLGWFGQAVEPAASMDCAA